MTVPRQNFINPTLFSSAREGPNGTTLQTFLEAMAKLKDALGMHTFEYFVENNLLDP